MKNNNGIVIGVCVSIAIIVSTLIVCMFVFGNKTTTDIPSKKSEFKRDTEGIIEVGTLEGEYANVSTPSKVAVEEETETVVNSDETIINDAIEDAEKYLSNREYDEAESIIADANRKVSDNTKLIEEIERINSLRPVSLLNHEILSGELSIFGSEEISTGETVRGIGVTFDDVLEAGETKHNTITYATMGEYDTFKGKLALLNDNSKNSPIECYIEIYTDGILSYTSPSVKKGSMPVDIEADITNANQVEIRFTCYNGTNGVWDTQDWASEKYYAINFMIYNAEFLPQYNPL